MVTIITVCVVIVTLIIVVEMLASLGHHEEYDEGYHEKLNYLIESVEKLQTDSVSYTHLTLPTNREV